MLKNILFFCLLFLIIHSSVVHGATPAKDDIQKRMALYKKMESITVVPWYYFAAIDQYERNIRSVRRDIPKKTTGIISIYIKPEIWSGQLNDNTHETNLLRINVFNGIGMDGDGDKMADQNNDEDILYSFSNSLRLQNTPPNYIKIRLWDYYQRAKTVELITQYAKIFQQYNRIDLKGSAFPVPLSYIYSYKDTWGDKRGFGGIRTHEGTDIFANYGTPVRATCYGTVEIKGWNRLGGWRIGIRDIYNNYYYYAHLGGFSKNIKVGQIVEPGTVIGSVGSTGYGPPGTSGKFPPHLHFGMYKDNGNTEYAFDPYYHLRIWERQERSTKK